MFPLLLSLLLVQGVRTQRIAEKPIDDDYSVVLMRTITNDVFTQRVVLQSRSDRNLYWNLEESTDRDNHYELARADRNSVVLFRANDYGDGDYVKLFFSVGAKRVTKRIEFMETALSQIPAAELQRNLGVSAEFVRELQSPIEPAPLPSTLPKLPQSTYDEFARARPQRVRDGYVRNGTQIQEEVVASFTSGDRIWFGKSFPDGEGFTGVGAIGYFDRMTKKYAFLSIPQIVNFSVSSLLVEGDQLWAGLVVHPEGIERSGGLLLHDLKAGATRTYPVTDVISKTARGPDGLYVLTTNGLYVLKGEQLMRHRIEPDMNGKPTIYSDQIQ